MMKEVSEIRYKSWICLFAWLALYMAGGCTEAEVESGDIPVHALKEVEAGFHLNVLANRKPVTRSVTFTPEGTVEADSLTVGEKERLVTRATQSLNEAQESKIASLWVGQFDASTGKLLFSKYFSTLTETTVNIKLKQSQNGATSHVWFVANADLGTIGTETELKEHVLTFSSNDYGLPSTALCTMTGMWKGIVQEEGVKDITVDLTRLLAKITFTYSMGNEENFSFTPSSVTLQSVPEKSQVDAPKSQLANMAYKTYPGTASPEGATMYWYLPENMAGTVSGDNAVDAEKKKTGNGVTNATYIELSGTAVQGGVTYEDVTFRFYPGSGMNNYDVERNSHYTMNVTLVGIDISDERITVGRIPPIEVTGGNMPAEKGGRKEVQITARPGQEWSFNLEEWLSAIIEDKTADAGVSVTHQGPAKVIFEAVSANPKAEARSVSFSMNVNGQNQPITITQEGSTLTKGEDISLGAASGSEGSSTCQITKGLPWQAVSSGEDWWNWATDNPVTSGDESDGNSIPLKIKSRSVNPSAQERTGKITITAGASVADGGYTGLKEEIAVKQAGSTVTGSTVELAPEAASGQSSSFTATPGLGWEARVTNGDWITLTGATSGSPTTGSAQDIAFDVTVNPTASRRSGEIVVRAGDESEGPTGVITVHQGASSLIASITPETALAATAGAEGTYKMNATSGLTYSFTNGFPSWLTVTGGTAATDGGTTTGSDQTFTYQTASVNPNGTQRSATVTVTAGEMTQDVTITQEGSEFSTTDGAATIPAEGGETTGEINATAGLAWSIDETVSNGITVSPQKGIGYQKLKFEALENTGGDRIGSFIVRVDDANDRTATVTAKQAAGQTGPAYATDNLQVQKEQPGTMNWSSADSYCRNLNAEGYDSGWRLPSKGELTTMYSKKGSLQGVSGFTPFVSAYYWSSTAYNSGNHWMVNFGNGSSTSYYNSDANYVRCVRDKEL